MRTLRFLTYLAIIGGCLAADSKKVVQPPGTAQGRPFSAALEVGDTLYVSGMTGSGKDGKISDKFEEEVQQTLDNISATMKAGGWSLADVVAVQVYLTDMDLFSRMNTVYMTNFKEPRPTRTTVGVAKLVSTAKIEITVTARRTK